MVLSGAVRVDFIEKMMCKTKRKNIEGEAWAIMIYRGKFQTNGP